MKKLCHLFILVFITTVSYSQIGTTLVMQSTPTAVLSEWATRKEVLTYIVDGGAGAQFQVKIKTELKTTDGTIVATTDLAKARTISLSSARTIFNAADVFPLEIMIFNGKYRTALDRTGKLLSGTYQLCVQLVRGDAFAPLSEIRCRNFFVASIQLPVLMMPAKDTKLDAEKAQTAIIFRWTPVIPSQSFPVYYRLQVFEILENQNPVQALRANYALLDKTIMAQTQFIWRPQISFLTDSLPKRFIWTIQTLDGNAAPLVQTDGNGESRSEPIIFSVIKPDVKK